MKYVFALVLLACSTLLTSCSLITRLDRVGCGAPQDIPNAKLLLFGGYLGSVEDPAFVGKVVCFQSSEAPTALGLEIPTGEQNAVDRYLDSDGDATSRAILLSGEFWQTDKDGRDSAAMFKLIEYARRMRQRGMPLTVLAFSEGNGSLAYSLCPACDMRRQRFAPNLTYNAFMARAIREFHASHPNLRIVALMDSAHANQAPIQAGSLGTILPTVYLLRDLKPSAVLLQHHLGYLRGPTGTEWSCLPDFCGVHKVFNSRVWVNSTPPGFYHDSRIKGYSITYTLSTLTASPPAIEVQGGRNEVNRDP